jgi:gas vesicle protein
MGNDGRDGSGVIFMAFLMGALTGAALALLWAPAPGEETRRLLAERAREGKDKAAEAARQGREFVMQQRESLNDAIARGRDAYQQAREQEQA